MVAIDKKDADKIKVHHLTEAVRILKSMASKRCKPRMWSCINCRMWDLIDALKEIADDLAYDSRTTRKPPRR